MSINSQECLKGKIILLKEKMARNIYGALSLYVFNN